MKLTLEQIEEANKETLENKNISLTPEQIEEANSAEISDPSIMADIGRVLMDTSENIAFAPLNLANIISEQVAGKKVVPDWYFNEARKQSVNIIADPLRSIGLEGLADKFSSSLLTEEGEVKETETMTGTAASVVPYIAGGMGIYKALGQGPKYVRGIVSGGMIDQILADPNEENIADAIQTHFPESDVADYTAWLASDEEDTLLTQRMKLFGEGLAVGAAADIVGGTVKLFKLGFDKYKKSYESLTDEEQGELIYDYLKDAKETVGLKSPETIIEYNETPEGAAQVAIQQSSSLRRFTNRFLTTRGYFSPKAYNAFEDSQYAQRQAVAQAEHIANRLQKSLDSIVDESENKEVIDTVNEVLTTDLSWIRGQSDEDKIFDLVEKFNLPKDVATEVVAARELIDKTSKNLLGSQAVPDSLKETINEGVGSYLRRSYRLYEDSGYKATPEVIRDAENYIFGQLRKSNKSLSDDEVFALARNQVDEIQKSGKNNKDFDYIASVRKVNKDILKQREEIADPIRALMGEIKEPSENIILTVSKANNLLETNKFYSNLEKLGHSGKYIFKAGDKNRPRENTIKITGTNSTLDGQYTTPEILAEIKNKTSSFGISQGTNRASEFYRGFLSLKGLSQKAKTVFSHVTHLRNVIGGAQFGAANGVNPFAEGSKETFKTLRNSVLAGGDKALDETYEKYLRLGIINTNVQANEFRALLDVGYESTVDNIAEKFSNKLAKYGISKQKQKFVENAYVATDDFYKINYFNTELSTLKKAFPNVSDDVLEERAADIVRNTMPNYDRVPKGIKALKELPIGSFFSFPAEIIRTSANIAKQGVRELKSGVPEIQKRGAQRLAGYTVSASAWAGVASGSAYLAGFNEDEQKAIHTLSSTPWSKVSPRNIVQMNGKIYTNDTQFVDSYSAVKEPIRMAAQLWADDQITEKEFDKKVLEITTDTLFKLLSPYTDQAILSKSLTDVAYAAMNPEGRTPAGKEIFTPGLGVSEKTMNMAFHVGESFVPGTVTSLKNLGNAAFETPNKSTGKPKSLGAELTTNLTGIKFSELDIDSALKYSISEYRTKESDIISVSPNFVRESSSILQRYDQREKKRRDLQVKLYEKVQAAEVLLGSRETSKLLRKHGMSRPERRAILNGQFLAREPSKALLDLIKEKTPFETEDGFKELRSKLREQHRSYRRTSLIKPLEVQQAVEEEDRLQRAVGGVVSTLVPNAPVEPDERINKLTGVPYNEEAGPAYMDETDPMRVLNMAAGGRVRKGKGGKLIELFMKKPAPVVAKSADEFVEKADDYLANSASKTTQRANTVGTATKASKYLDEIGAKGRSLDYGAGKGLNAEANKIDDTFEPFPEETFSPTFVSPKEVPENTYGKVISTNVINVLPPNLRKEAVTKIGKSLKSGGKALIQTWDAGAAKAGMASKKATVVDDEPLAFTTSTGSYQKGFTNKELEQYVTETLGEGFEVSAVPSKKGISGVSVVITRKPQRLEKNKGGKVLNTLKRNCSK